MKYEKMPIAEVRGGDAPAMVQAIEELARVGADARRPNNPYQLKVSPDLSYYPTKGSILKDGDPAPLRERGLGALISRLRADGIIPPAPPSPKPTIVC